MQVPAIIFDSKPNPERTPDRLRTIAALKGVSTASIQQCSVLDIGCGTGMDLIAHALSAPQSSFVGIDTSEEHLAVGKDLIAAMGLRNVQLHKQDILTFEIESQSYDYIVCHGVYSWVPKQVQKKILSLCSQGLQQHGVAYISFNTQPGWATRGALRKYLALFDDQTLPAFERVEAARERMKAMLARLEDSQTAYTQQLFAEVRACGQQSAAFVYHELLSPVCDSFFLDEFCQVAAEHNLQYLGDGRPSRMRIQNDELEDQHFRKALQLSLQDAVVQEQVWDILLPNSIRGCLLVHSDLSLDSTPNLSVFENSFFTSTLVPLATSPRIIDRSIEIFTDPREYTFEIAEPTFKAILFCLSEQWPQVISFADLHKAVLAHVPECSKDTITTFLSEYFFANLLDVFQSPPSITRDISELPQVFPLARQQAAMGYDWVSNTRFEFISISELDSKILPLLDGAHTQQTILQKLGDGIAAGDFEVAIKEEAKESEPLDSLLKEQLQYSLAFYAESALLIA